MKRKLITSLLVIVLVLACALTVFAACDKRDYDYTITFYTQQNDDLQKVTASVIEQFEAAYPGWHVDHQVISNGYDGIRDKVVADLSGKKQPDLAYCYADHVSLYMQTGKVVDVSKFINSTDKATYVNKDGETVDTGVNVGYSADELSHFIPAYYNEGKGSNFTDYDKYGFTADSMLMMPFAKSTELMFYNKTALDACGLKPAETWDEMWAQIPDIEKKFPKATLLGYDSEANWFITESERQGWGYTSVDANQHYLFNNSKAAAWLDTLGEMRSQITSQNKYGSYTSNLFKLGADNGGVIYCVGSSGGAKNQDPGDKFTLGVTHVPYSTDGEGNVLPNGKLNISQGPSLVMLSSDKAKNPEQKQLMTWLFIKMLYQPSTLASVASLQGYCSPMDNTAEQVATYAEFLQGDSAIAQATKWAEQLSKEGLLFTSPAFVGSSEARTQVGNALQFVIEGLSSGTEALQTAYNNCGGK